MKRVTNAFGETIRESKPIPVREVVKPSTSARLVEILRAVVTKGTGKEAAIDGVDVIGKTGTAQKAQPTGGYSKEKQVASFVGALLGLKPRVVIFVMIDEPGGKYKTGGKIAAPLFRRIAAGVMAFCGGNSTEPGLVLASSEVGVSQPEGEAPRLIKVRRGPQPGEWIAPDLKGLTMRQVIDLCGKIQCDASFHGTGLVVEQNPKPGDIFKEGATLEVSFSGQAS
jgi:hypothetical protein